ncbi:carbon-nitrogen hydrolase family protein [Euzebya tangerina]|uniref:carbon-nitrogen hydrolase family protein n=1 Tax=Euzebya tangerina TaxID=591198 RepID=UPI000E3190A4|nr:carbon-nitrogen hydrolase family protein [Euzebya tangerina]
MSLVVSAVQTGGMGLDAASNERRLLDLFAQAGPAADLVVFPEMITGPYFPVAPYDESYLTLSERVPGRFTEVWGAAAREHDAAVLIGMFEDAGDDGRYNAVVHIDRGGALVEGTLADGRTLPTYRKMAVADVEIPAFTMDEQAYCGFGQGQARFPVDDLPLGTLICYDRAFSEVWAGLASLDVEIVVAAVSSFGWREELFVDDLRLRAMEFGVFVVAANRSGPEHVGGVDTTYFGRSCIIAPDGTVLAEAGSQTRDEIITAEVDLSMVKPARQAWVVEDRRPEMSAWRTS